MLFSSLQLLFCVSAPLYMSDKTCASVYCTRCILCAFAWQHRLYKYFTIYGDVHDYATCVSTQHNSQSAVCTILYDTGLCINSYYTGFCTYYYIACSYEAQLVGMRPLYMQTNCVSVV